MSLPSPQLTVTSRMAEPLVVAAVTAIVKVEGNPALGIVAGGVMMSVGAEATFTVTVPEAVPLPVVGVVGVVPVPGGVVPVLDPACAPTATVTVAAVDVLRTAVAMPL